MPRIIERAQSFGLLISKPTAIVGVLGLLMIATVTIMSVVARAVFNAPLVWGHDLSTLIIIIVVATCFPTGVMLRKHIAIEFLGSALGPRGQRILDTLGALVTAVALTGLAWQMTVVASEETAYKTTTIVTRIPMWPVWWTAAALVWASVPLQLVVLLNVALGTRGQSSKEEHL